MRVRIKSFNERDPILLHKRYDWQIRRAIARWVLGRPDGGLLCYMRDTHAGGFVAGIGDVVVVIPVSDGGGRGFGRVVRRSVVDKEAGAHVAEVAVCGGCRAPIFAYAGAELGVILVFGWIEGLDGGELGGVEEGELGLQPGVGGVNGGTGGVGHENGAFV